ncbi:MAG: hypothetical protein ACOYN7_02720 [Candidatus Nanopelagicales bacterium]
MFQSASAGAAASLAAGAAASLAAGAAASLAAGVEVVLPPHALNKSTDPNSATPIKRTFRSTAVSLSMLEIP